MAQVTEIVLPDGRIYRPDDWTAAEPLYSDLEITSGPYQTLSAFSYGISQQVPGTTRNAKYTDTNLQGEGGRLPDNEEILIYAMEIEAYVVQLSGQSAYGPNPDAIPVPDLPDVSLLDMLRMQRDLVIKARFVTTQAQTDHPMGWYPASTGTRWWNGGARTQNSNNTVGTVIGNNGWQDANARRLFAVPFYLSNGEQFGVDFTCPNGEVGVFNPALPKVGSNSPLSVDPTTGRIRLRTIFDGFRRRPVA